MGQDRVRLLGRLEAARLTKLAPQIVSKGAWRGTVTVINVNPQPPGGPAMKKGPRNEES